jgi:membrane-associated phospholipid phosphatase
MPVSTFWTKPHIKTLLILFIGVLAPLGVFGALAEDVIEKKVFSFDQPILLFVHSYASPLLDQVMYFFTTAGSALVLVPFNVVVFGVLILRRRRAAATFWALAVTGAALLNFLAKIGFARTRPALWISRLAETTYSFPSGHAMQSMAVATALTVILWQTRWKWSVLAISVPFVLLVGLSRVYWGVHYPSDILAGWAASFAWVIGLKFLFDKRAFTTAIPRTAG